ncbi:MAG: cytidylate kinase-like family protein [Clostridiales bacterium]|nr:cytidylate kinase-like family protein [Clostridiales bacterium]
MNKIITIGREFGSGGRELGRLLAEKLQFAYYDKEIISEIANRTELSEQYIQSVVEHRPINLFPIHTGQSFYAYAMPNPLFEQNQEIYAQQNKIIHEMAERSDCVIVGRCADYILRDYNPFRIFVYADMSSKIKRCREKGEDPENLTDKALKKKIYDVDKERAKYYNTYTDHVWGDKKSYDLCINTTYMELEEVAEALTKMIFVK